MLHFQDVVIIDFQDARLGPPVYDLVSLLCDSYVELNQGSVNYLLDYYKNNFSHFDACFKSWDQFMGFYNLQVIQRCFKACGSFASFKVMRNDTRYLAYIQPTLQRVHHQLKMTGAMPRFEGLLSASESEWRKI
jgi:aminoglycoside/choline kinase family phosphotransferase